MYHRTDLIYLYDGTFDGFLCCVFDAVYHKRFPTEIYREDDEAIPALLPLHRVETEFDKARRVAHSIPEKIGREAQQLVRDAFLTALPQKEAVMLRFLLKGYHEGPDIVYRLGDDDVYALRQAVQHLGNEAHLLKGFIRFSDADGVLVAEIEPKNQVLPVLAEHFIARFSGERFLIYDRTHHSALIYDRERVRIIAVEKLELPPPGVEERAFRALWKQFYETIAIEARYNPRCQRTHMPLRYRGVMTEHQAFDARKEWEDVHVHRKTVSGLQGLPVGRNETENRIRQAE